MMSLRKGAAILICALWLGGCSLGARLAYNNLDWLVEREIDDYVSLSRAQEQRFSADFERWWRWHRNTQLPEYATALRTVAALAGDGLDRQEIDESLVEFERFYLAAMNRGYPDFAALLASLDDEQVDDVLQALREDLEKFRKDEVDTKPEERRRRWIKRARKSLEGRLGRLESAQKQIIERWAIQREDLTEQWLASRQTWLQRFAEVLASRAEPDFAARLRPLIFDPAAYWEEGHGDAVTRNQLRQLDMLVEISALSTPRQRQHFRDELLKFAEICERLAARGGETS